MTVPAQDRFTFSSGNGVTTTFPYTFMIPGTVDDPQFLVYLIEIVTGARTDLTVDVDYSIAGLGVEEGGVVTYPLSGTPLPATHRLVIESNMPYEQQTDVYNSGTLYLGAIEDQFDNTTRQIQQIQDRVNRTFSVGIGYEGNYELFPVADMLIGWNGDGTGLENKLSDSERAAAAYAAQLAAEAAAASVEAAVASINPIEYHDFNVDPSGGTVDSVTITGGYEVGAVSHVYINGVLVDGWVATTGTTVAGLGITTDDLVEADTTVWVRVAIGNPVVGLSFFDGRYVKITDVIDNDISNGTFSTALTSGQQNQVTTRPAVFTSDQAKIALSSSYTGSDIQPAVHVTTKIDDDSGASAAAKVAGIYSYMEQTGSNTNQYPKAIAGVAVNAAIGNNDATGVVGYAYKLQATGGIGDAAAIGGAAWQYSDQEGLVIGCETSAHQNVPGTSSSPNATSGNNTMSLHVTTNSTGARAWSGVALDTFGLNAGRYGFWNAINIGRSCFAAGAEGMGQTGTVGINFGNNTTTGPEKAIQFGNAEYHMWRADTAAIRMHASSLDFEKLRGGQPGVRLITPSANHQGGYFGTYKGATGPDGTTLVTATGALVVTSNNYTSLYSYDTAGNLSTRVGLSPSDNAFIPIVSGATKLGAGSRLWSEVFASTGTINTSDERFKRGIDYIDDAVLDAWERVDFRAYQFSDAWEKKGDGARIHFGVIAQQVMAAFEAEGLDPMRYGVVCFDEWGEEKETENISRVLVKHAVYEQVLVRDAVYDDVGNEVKPAVYGDGDLIEPEEYEEIRTVNPGIAGGNRYGIRYEEAMILEVACQRRRADRIEARISAIEQAIYNIS